MIISVIQSDEFVYTILPDTTVLTAYSNHFKRTTTSLPYYQTQPYLPVYTNHFNNKHLSTILPDTTVLTCLQKPPYNSIHLTHSLPYYQRHNYTYLPTATFLQQRTPVYHTTRDTTYLPAYSNHLTITSTCLPYFQRHD